MRGFRDFVVSCRNDIFRDVVVVFLCVRISGFGSAAFFDASNSLHPGRHAQSSLLP